MAAEETARPWGDGIATLEEAQARCCISTKSPSCCVLTCKQNTRRGTFKWVDRTEPEFPSGSVACSACSNKYTEQKARAASQAAKRTRNDVTAKEDASQNKSPRTRRTASRSPLSGRSSSTDTPMAPSDEQPPSARELESSALIASLQRELADMDSELEAQDRVIKEQGKALATILRVLDTEPADTVLASLRALRITASMRSVHDE